MEKRMNHGNGSEKQTIKTLQNVLKQIATFLYI